MANSEDRGRKTQLEADLKNIPRSPSPTSLEEELDSLNILLTKLSLHFNSSANKKLEVYEDQSEAVVYDGGFDLYK